VPKNEYFAKACALEQQEQYQEAQHILEQLYAAYPNDLAIAYKLGCFYASIGATCLALDTFQSILRASPENAVQTMYNIGYVLKTAGRVDQAIEWYNQVLSIDPSYEAASFGLGIALLYKGDFEKGWQQHEKHLQRTHKNAPELRNFLQSNTLQGKIILLRPDGGMGDTIQFIRYAQLLKDKGARVIAAVQKPLVPLLSLCPYLDQVISTHEPLPLCHDWCPVMSLPAVFNSNEQTIPHTIPYLHADASRSMYWKHYIERKPSFNIGICWQADVHNDSSRPPFARRGMPLKYFFELAAMPHVHLYSLQQKDGVEQLKHMPEHIDITTFDESFDVAHGPFMDTAALISHLDLVITVDTAIAHLAGALGVRVWLLLPYCTDWRWIVGRTDSPWYPSMRIFKQKEPFDWQAVMNEVAIALKEMAQPAVACRAVGPGQAKAGRAVMNEVKQELELVTEIRV
jgi:hypothetical protein